MNIRMLHLIQSGIQNRPTFFIAASLGIVISLILSLFTHWTWSTIVLLGWNSVVWFYLIMLFQKIWQSEHQDIQQRAQKQDESKWIIMLIVLLSLIMSMISIIAGLSDLPEQGPTKVGHIIIAIFTIVSSWLMMHTIFAIHYAHDFYIARLKQKDGGLTFPNTEYPTYPDFIYFSYIIGTSAQTADVSITTRKMRLLNIFHCTLSFCFNTSLLAILINVVAGFI